jgi:hypothetical protein
MTSSPRRRPATALLLGAATALAMTACGGGARSPHDGAARAGTRIAGPPPGQAARPRAVSRTAGPVRAHGPKDEEHSGDAARPLRPCTLVTRTEARAILGRAITGAIEAPQGPTCVYSAQGAHQPVTLAVQSTGLRALERRKGVAVASLTLHGHRAYCVKDGGLTMFVPLSGERFLSVTAPCPIAARFAAKALVRLQR